MVSAAAAAIASLINGRSPLPPPLISPPSCSPPTTSSTPLLPQPGPIIIIC